MELPKIGKSRGGMLDGIKSKLGFASSNHPDDYNDEYYDDYGEYGDYDDGDPSYDDGYESYAPANSRRSSYSGAGSREGGSPRLVSMDDVRASTQLPDSLSRNPLPERQVTSAQSGSSYVSQSASGGYRPNRGLSSRTVERAADYMISTDTSDLPLNGSAQRSPGYDSLFSSTSSALPSSAPSVPVITRPGTRSFDPYETFEGTGISAHNPTRSLNVLKPVSYGEVERIAKIVRAGDVVVLSLRNTPDHLVKRVLDFSFGVSSALDASVECIADKVFVIIRGRALSEEELVDLRNQGVIA